MVHVIINSYKNSTHKEDLILLDFQGSFHVKDEVNLDNLKVGDLTLEQDSAILVIGHHRLVGKKVQLTKPFAVIHKNETNAMVDEEEEEVSYDVVKILKEKYIFTNRPGLIVQENRRGLSRMDK
ncbi:Ctf8-domain-containing protein [Cokeromyces recurvatus]|uniref:Ctf8-domain-containing protein n=1 Tax=Cokeromyces recurvatus TaxID=90255 RepID=UPI00221FF1DC|nr:Ctf8-domain-containing protein [Cokeromyces recurvatus]KAI7904482.1 Ctf8-domain-containing protein [Cokeromyces recurvatus]